MATNVEQFDSYLVDFEKRLVEHGLLLHEHQVLMALRQREFQDALREKLNEAFTLTAVVRVYYTQAVSLIEVLARFRKGEGVAEKHTAVLATLKATTFEVVSIAKSFEEPSELAPEGTTLVPFTMSNPTDIEAVGRGNVMSKIEALELKRAAYLNEIIGEDGKRRLAFAPTNCSSCNPSSSETSYQSQYTTGTGGNTYPDYKTDTKQDDTTDCHTDVSDDQNNS
ncbi:MAG: hypothetical protein LW870_19105 [Pirellula sp.]|jgi:hypothetical protein|nr:hypothetical protein [Pirellula sp.]